MKSVKMPKDEYLAEHKELIRTLKKPNRKNLNKEAQKQRREVKSRLGVAI